MTSFFFTFMNLIEFCVILAISKQLNDQEDNNPVYNINGKRGHKFKVKSTSVINRIEQVCKILIPVGYAIFIVAFLSTHLGQSQHNLRPGRLLIPMREIDMEL